MKTKEEIEQLADNFYPLVTTDLICSPKLVRDGYFKGYTQCQEDMTNNVKVTRFEVIDESGRVCTRHNCQVRFLPLPLK
jgi:hypothetical protein